MTREELIQAMEDGTWLVYTKCLCRVQRSSVNYQHVSEGDHVWVTGPKVGHMLVTFGEVRVASPNDMLKYGE